MIDRTKEYVDFTKICGDCGRRFKMKFEMPEWNLNTKKGQKEVKKFVEFFFPKYNVAFFPKYNVACNQCNKKKEEKLK